MSVTFGRAVNTELRFGRPDPIVIDDFDNDGSGDVAVASPGGSKFQLGLYLNNGDQTFREALVLDDVPEQDALTAANLNGDGNADLVQVSSNNQSATVLFGDGNGGFPTRSQLSTTHNPKSVTIADMDDDGNQDLVLGTNNRGGVNVFLGDGQGGFTEAAGLVEDVRRVKAIETGDFNNDGNLDVIGHDSGRVGTVQLLAGDGQGGFTLTNSIDLTDGFSAARDLGVGDFNNDGNLDWVIAELRQDKVEIMFGDGNGGVQSRTERQTDTNPLTIDVSDFDQDGQADLAVGHGGSQTVRVYEGNADGEFILAEDAAINGDLDNINDAASGDLNGDGFADLVFSNASNGGVISAMENQAPLGLPKLTVDLQWTTQIGTDGEDKVIDTAVTSDGQLVVVSQEQIRSGEDRVSVEKYDAQGNEIWSRDFGNSNTDVDAVEVDARDNVYFTGEVELGQIGSLSNHFSTLNSGSGNFNGSDPYLAKFSAGGERVFFERFGSSDVTRGQFTNLAVSDDGTAYVSARAEGPFTPEHSEPAPSDDLVVSAFSSSGDLDWSQMIGGGGNDRVSKIALDPATGDLIVAGRSDADMSTLAIGGGDDFSTTPTFIGQADDQHQGFLLRLDASAEGEVTAVRQFELRQGTDSIDGLSVDALGQVTVVGDAGNEGLESGRGTPLVSVQIPYARRFDSDFGDVWTRQDNSRNDAFLGQDGHSDVVEGPGGLTYVSGGSRAHTSVYDDDGRLLADVTDEFFSQVDGQFDDGITTISSDGLGLYVGGGTNNAWAGTSLGGQDGWLARLEVSRDAEGVTELYTAIFGRAPDTAGRQFWLDKVEQGVLPNRTALAEAMFATNAAREQFPDDLTNEEIITRFFENTLGRTPDSGGLEFWTSKLDQTGSVGATITDMINAVRNFDPANFDDPQVAQQGADSRALFERKVAVGEFFTNEGAGDVAGAEVILDAVTADSDVSTPRAIESIIDSATSDIELTGVGGETGSDDALL